MTVVGELRCIGNGGVWGRSSKRMGVQRGCVMALFNEHDFGLQRFKPKYFMTC